MLAKFLETCFLPKALQTCVAIEPSQPSASLRNKLVWLALLAPALVALLFISLYATPMPLTDEWLFLRGAMHIKAANLTTLNGWDTVAHSFVFRIYDHCVAVPFALYLLVANLANFDNRALVGITFICFVTQTWLYHRFVMGQTWWTLPIAVLLFSTAHYTEFLWGFQFTIALSILFPLAGLIIAERSFGQLEPQHTWRLVLALALLTLGAMSAGGGTLGFAACAVLLWARPLGWQRRIALSILLSAACLAFLLGVSSQGLGRSHVNPAKVLQALTMLGGCIWGSPPSVASFRIDHVSVTGGLIVLAGATALFRAVYLRKVHYLVLPLAITVFGALTTGATVSAREWLGNYHLQYALAAICGAYAMAYHLSRQDRSCYGRAPLVVLLSVLAFLPFGYVRGFATDGPRFNRTARLTEDYARRVTREPDLKKPFPVTGGWDFDAEMAAFLTARGHPSMVSPSITRPSH